MKRIAFVVIALVVVLSVVAARTITRPAFRHGAPRSAVDVYRSGLDALDTALVRLDAALATGNRDSARVAFRRTRAAYKRIEVFAEYYGSGIVRELNGPPIPKAEDEDPETPLAPVGLQMIEAALFPGGDSGSMIDSRRYVPYMRLAIRSLRAAGVDTMPGDAYVFDAARQELARVSTFDPREGAP